MQLLWNEYKQKIVSFADAERSRECFAMAGSTPATGSNQLQPAPARMGATDKCRKQKLGVCVQSSRDRFVSTPSSSPQAESEEFLWRIGPLNCYNPMKPDRFYDLDLTHRDDREVCKVGARKGSRLGGFDSTKSRFDVQRKTHINTPRLTCM